MTVIPLREQRRRRGRPPRKPVMHIMLRGYDPKHYAGYALVLRRHDGGIETPQEAEIVDGDVTVAQELAMAWFLRAALEKGAALSDLAEVEAEEIK